MKPVSNLMGQLLKPYVDPSRIHAMYNSSHSHEFDISRKSGIVALADESKMVETKMIEALAANLISSPQVLANSLYYRMRITGTGDVWREESGKTYRAPEDYLNPEFLQRCTGLPIVVIHPKEEIVDQKSKLVGTMVFSYIPEDRPTEVWGIGRITDGDAQKDLLQNKLSTSPSVITAAPTKEGAEGVPLFIDHLAIVPLGVWDHDGPPQGIDQDVLFDSSADSVTAEYELDSVNHSDEEETLNMNPEELKELLADALKEHLAPVHQRLDKLEDRKEKHADSAAEPVEKEPFGGSDKEDVESEHKAAEGESDNPVNHPDKKADSAPEGGEEEHGGHKADCDEPGATMADSDEDEEVNQNSKIAALEAEIAALKKAKEPTSDEDYAELADAQAMADSVAKEYGQRAQAPMPGEKPLSYRRRMVKQFQKYSEQWKGFDLSSVKDPQLMKNIEVAVYADARKISKKVLNARPGLTERETILGDGRKATVFDGDMNVWLSDFTAAPLKMKGLR